MEKGVVEKEVQYCGDRFIGSERIRLVILLVRFWDCGGDACAEWDFVPDPFDRSVEYARGTRRGFAAAMGNRMINFFYGEGGGESRCPIGSSEG